MVTGHCRLLQEKDPRKIRIVYEKYRWHPAWDNNPRIVPREVRGDFQEFYPRTNGMRPYCSAKSGKQWTWKPYSPPKGELYFSSNELEAGEKHKGLVIVEPRLKPGASPNKDWGWARWNKLAWLLRKRGIIVTQLGAHPEPLLQQVGYVSTPTMRHAAAIMAKARAAVLTEGGLHHVAAAVGTPAVVIYGGYISPEVTGYKDQVNLFTGGGLGCGMRVHCNHCAEAMAAITPEEVVEKLLGLM